VFGTRQVSKKLLDAMLGFAAGVMIAASYWSLLAPAIEMSAELGLPGWLPPALGILLGGAFLATLDKLLPHLHAGLARDQAEGLHTTWRRSVLLVLAITLHNIPEGLAVGVAFGAVSLGLAAASLAGAVALAVGIGLQNIPEGLAVALPLRREGLSPLKSFWYGQLSALVEPLAALVGAGAVRAARPMLPYALSFAAGAMLFVVAEDLIPEAQREGNTDLATLGLLTGFVVMMVLDVGLG
jgi:ZIP family zinc transporter